jgi:hypothetical protein
VIDVSENVNGKVEARDVEEEDGGVEDAVGDNDRLVGKT